MDPWDVEYGPEFPANVTNDRSTEEVVLDIEVSAAAWSPITPRIPQDFDAVYFVDGVRRIDARLLVRKGKQLIHGVFGSAAVGSASIAQATARCTSTPEIDRAVVLGSGALLPSRIEIAPALTYVPASCSEPEVDAPLRAVQNRMRDAEHELVRRLADHQTALVVADGRLDYNRAVKGAVLGFIKRVHELYLPTAHWQTVTSLSVGQRTPLFVLSEMKRGMYSWFQRIGVTHPGDSDFSGIVRMEVSTQVGKEEACRLADSAASLLPRFVPSRSRDPRAPQNLLPIGALEAHLRRCLGDSRLTRRRIQSLIASEAPYV